MAATAGATLVVLDLRNGKTIRTITDGVDGHVELRVDKDVLLATDLHDMTAFDAENGNTLWSIDTRQPMHHCSAFVRAPVIAGQWIYDEPYAYQLTTGQRRDGRDGKPWHWGGFRGCGTVSASENLLLYRTGYPALLDVTGNTGQHQIPSLQGEF